MKSKWNNRNTPDARYCSIQTGCRGCGWCEDVGLGESWYPQRKLKDITNFSIRHDCRRHYDRHEMLNSFTSTVNNNTVLENFSVSHMSNHTLLQESAQSDRCSCAGLPPLLALNSVSLQQVVSCRSKHISHLIKARTGVLIFSVGQKPNFLKVYGIWNV